MKKSVKYSVNLRDWLRGLLFTVFPIYSAAVQTWASVMPVDWMLVNKAAIAAFVLYIGKNFFDGEKK